MNGTLCAWRYPSFTGRFQTHGCFSGVERLCGAAGAQLAQADQTRGHHRAGGGYQLGHAPERYAQGFCVFTGASRPEADHEGKPRLLVDHGQQDERLPQG